MRHITLNTSSIKLTATANGVTGKVFKKAIPRLTRIKVPTKSNQRVMQ